MTRAVPIYLLILSLAGLQQGTFAFNVASNPMKSDKLTLYATTSQEPSNSISSGRRQVLTTSIAGAAAAFVSGFNNVQPAFADISDGNALPDGAARFARVLRVRSDLDALDKRIGTQSSEMDAKEWDGVGTYLRKLYQAGDDMKEISKGIYDPTKKKNAEEDIKNIQKLAKQADNIIGKQDVDGFMSFSKKEKELIDDFLDSLRDVPDEI